MARPRSVKFSSRLAILAVSFLPAAINLHADIALPTGGFNGGGTCSESSVGALPAVNGIEGVGLTVSCSAPTPSPLFQADVNGATTGGTIAAGTPIAFTFSFQATEQNAAFPVSAFTADFAALANSALGPANLSGFQAQTLFDGFCGPFTNQCFSIQEAGSGILSFPVDLPSGTLSAFGFDLATTTSGTANLTLNATVDFNVVPEPGHLTLVLLGFAALYVAGNRLRARWRRATLGADR